MKKLILVFALLIGVQIAYSQYDDSAYLAENYVKTEAYIPMRDGVKLYTIIYSPKDQSTTYPIILNRTPYSIPPYGDEMGFVFRRGLHPGFLREKFIFVFQDLRGRFMSEGEFVHMRPFIENKTTQDQIDESSDAYDTMDWLVKNVKNNNGRIGMFGISYPGFYTSMATINAHPALKCASPQAPISDWFFDDPHHHGAFFQQMVSFVAAMDVPRIHPYQNWIQPYNWDTPDGYNFYLNLGVMSNVNKKYFGDSIAYWNEIMAHPNYDNYWQARSILPHLKNIKPAVLIVGGWFDAEDLYGTFHTYQAMDKNTPNNKVKMVIGPWIHGGWARTDGDHLGNVSFDQKTSLYYRDSIELPFFTYYLKDKGNLNLQEATVFETGKNEWEKYDQWPPKNTKEKALYLHENGKLSFKKVDSSEKPFDEYVSDPSEPVPYTEDVAFSMTKEYMTDDQRFASRRPDVLTYQTDVLAEDITLAGPLLAQLKVSTSGTASDWVVKLIDVYPSDAPDNEFMRRGMKMADYQQMVRSEVLRGRFRNSYENPEAFESNKVEEINLPLQDVLHCFKKGHRIMIQVQSTWFPLVDRNPQQYVPNIFEAKESDFIKTTQRVYHTPDHVSSIEMKLLQQ